MMSGESHLREYYASLPNILLCLLFYYKYMLDLTHSQMLEAAINNLSIKQVSKVKLLKLQRFWSQKLAKTHRWQPTINHWIHTSTILSGPNKIYINQLEAMR